MTSKNFLLLAVFFSLAAMGMDAASHGHVHLSQFLLGMGAGVGIGFLIGKS